MSNSKIVQSDVYSEQSYAMDKFDPKTNDSKYSYTSGRVMKRVYNQYVSKNKPKVFGYYTDWSQYDKRASESKTGAIPPAERGRGIDLTQLSPTAYDKLIVGFMGVVGDGGMNKSVIDRAAAWTGKKTNEMTILDPWGDCQSYFNNGFSGWTPIGFGSNGTYSDGTSEDCFYQNKVQGVLGALRDLQAKALKQGHNLALSFSLGGWSMSHAFHELAKSDAAVATLSASIVDFFQRFPMFSEIDIDWEYPNAPGIGNPFGPEDGENYVRLIGGLRRALDKKQLNHVKISIASSANVDMLKDSNIPGLLAAGLYGINVMTYDFFGTPWAERLNNHASIYKTETSAFSLQEAVEYLLEQNVDAERINIGYAGYSRSAKGAEISSYSPLDGTYNGNGTTVGTFESGCVEWCDIISNYLDLENQCGRNGYHVYTDAQAGADYLYNPELKVFHSIETPRSVREKARYVIEKGLGGLFTWTVDQDNGLLVNAAREGMGCACTNQVIDMSPFYFTGENITDGEVVPPKPDDGDGKDDDQDDQKEPTDNLPPTANIMLQAKAGQQLTFTAAGCSDPDKDALSYLWAADNGATLVTPLQMQTTLKLPQVTSECVVTLSLTVDDGHQHQAQALCQVLVSAGADEQDPDEKADYPLWTVTTSYTGGNKVSHRGNNYQAKWWVDAGVEPGLASTTGSASGDSKPWFRI